MIKFPHQYKEAYKCEFDDVLTSCKKIKNSSCFLSLISLLVNGFQTVIKKIADYIVTSILEITITKFLSLIGISEVKIIVGTIILL